MIYDILHFRPMKGWEKEMAERDPIDLIREQLNRTDGLIGLHADHELFIRWHSETKTILEKIFSPKSIHYQSFLALRFREVSAKAFASPEIDKINATRYKRDLENVKNILQGAIKELTLDRTLFKKIQTTPKTVEISLKGEYFISSSISELEMIHAIQGVFEGSGLEPACSAEVRAKGVSLSDRIEQIKRARFGIYDISAPEKPDVFLELGAALGLGREAIILCRKGSSPPEALRQLDRIEYEGFPELSERLKKRTKM